MAQQCYLHKLPDYLGRILRSPICALWFLANAPSNEGFSLLKASELGARGGFTASIKDGLESDES